MKLPLLFFFVLMLTFFANGQAITQPEQGYLKSYVTDTRDLIVQPVHWRAKEWVAVGAAAATFTGLLFADEAIHQFAQNNQTPAKTWVSTYFAEPIGSGLYTLPALGILYGTGWLTDNKKNRYVAMKATEAWLLTGGATFVLKQLFHRQRPNEGVAPNAFIWHGPFALTSNYTSFPSGHTSTAFAVASVVATSYDEWWIKTLSYSCASLVGLSRVYDGKHWASDVFVGALLGWWVGHSIAKNPGALQWGAVGGQDYFLGTLSLCF